MHTCTYVHFVDMCLSRWVWRLDWHHVSLLNILHFFFYSQRISFWTCNPLILTRISYLAFPKDLYLCFPGAGIIGSSMHSLSYIYFLFFKVESEMEPRYSYLQGKHFTDWAICPASRSTSTCFVSSSVNGMGKIKNMNQNSILNIHCAL